MAKRGETWEDSWDRLWETRMGEMRKEWIRGMVAIAARKKALRDVKMLKESSKNG